MIIKNSDILILEDYREGGYGSIYILIWKNNIWGDRQ